MSNTGDSNPGTPNLADQLGQPAPEQNQGSENQPPAPLPEQHNWSPYAQNFLAGVPEGERAVIEPHLKNWDKGFTQYAQRRSAELKQYQDLGEYDTVSRAAQMWDQLVSDPKAVTKWLIDNGYGPEAAKEIAKDVTGQQQPDPYSEKFTGFESKLEKIERALGLIGNNFQQQQQAAQIAESNKQLDTFITGMKQNVPGIDDQFILALLQANITDPTEIAGRWRALEQSVINRRPAPTPPNVLGANSGPPPAGKSPAEYTDKERKDALYNSLFGGQ